MVGYCWLGTKRLLRYIFSLKRDTGEILFDQPLFDHFEAFWRQCWPPSDVTNTMESLEKLAEACPSTLSNPCPALKPLTGIEFAGDVRIKQPAQMAGKTQRSCISPVSYSTFLPHGSITSNRVRTSLSPTA